MSISTRRPTSLPPWPVLLIAGAEKAGKSWACAQASASEKVGRTLWVSVGETDPDQYGAIPGANFEIVEHDNTLRGIAAAIQEIATMPATEPPTLLVVDSMTRLWDMVSDQAQAEANARAQRNNKYRGDDVQIGMDLWNKAKTFHARVVSNIMAHPGPVLLTARLDTVAEVGDGGKPTGQKLDKIKAEKNLQYDVDGVIKMPQRGTTIVEGIRSTVLMLEEPTRFPEFSVDRFWGRLGLDQVAARTVSTPAQAGEQKRSEITLDVARERVAHFIGNDVDKLRAFWVEARDEGAGQDVLDFIADRATAAQAPVEGPVVDGDQGPRTAER